MVNEKRLISLDEALKSTRDEIYWTESQQAAVRFFLVQQPRVDAVEIKHGEWSIAERNTIKRTVLVECTNCNAMFELAMFAFGMNYNYCPNCGADMRGENE